MTYDSRRTSNEDPLRRRAVASVFALAMLATVTPAWAAPPVSPASPLSTNSSSQDSPVADAAMHGDVEAVRSLLRDGADVNAAQGDGMTALHWAARLGQSELVEVLLYAGAKLDAGTRIGRYTPLHIAAREGRRSVVRVLLDAGADPGVVTTNSGATPLHLAARSGDREIVELLIQHGAEVDATAGSWGQTPLTFAAALNRVEAIEVLLAAGADPNAQAVVVDVAEMSAADNAAEQRLQEVLQGFQEQQGGGPTWQPTPNQVQAAIDLARQVQTRWPDVPRDDDEGEEEGPSQEVEPEESENEAAEEDEDEAKPSGEAEEAKEVAAIDEEVATGALTEADGTLNPECVQPEADSAEASEEGEAVAEQSGSCVEADEEQRPLSYAQQVGEWGGLGPLHHAVRQGHVNATLALLDGGADIDRLSGDHTTPLLMAAINGQWDLAGVLLERGADPTIASNAGATPLYAVLEREWEPRASYAHPTAHQQQRTTHLEMMKLLLEAGADPDARLTKHLWYMEYTFGVLRGSGINLKGATPFWRATYALDLEAMRLLSAYNADTDIPTMKPPQRRRRAAPMEEEVEVEVEPEPEGEEEGEELEQENVTEDDVPLEEPDTTLEEEQAPEAEEGDEADDEDKLDPSGLPPVPTDGPAIHAIHAASGVGYGQSFAGNAHRYVPNGWLPALRFLVEEMGADVNARDANGYTALHHAASRGDVEMIRYLIEKGADVTVVSRKGETTADMANGPIQRVRPYPEAIALLESLGSENNQNCLSCE